MRLFVFSSLVFVVFFIIICSLHSLFVIKESVQFSCCGCARPPTVAYCLTHIVLPTSFIASSSSTTYTANITRSYLAFSYAAFIFVLGELVELK